MPLHSIQRANSGLHAAMRNLSTTGHNMANVSTEGFSRQRVNQVDFFSHGLRPATGPSANLGIGGVNPSQIGLGTDISSVLRLRNEFLDNHFRHEIGAAHFYDTMRRSSYDIEVTMGELTNTSSGLVVTRQLWASLQELSLDPGAMDSRSNFLSGINSFLNRFNDTHRRLREQQQVLNSRVKELVHESNDLLNTIDRLNSMIQNAEISGQAANDFRDSRDLAMDRLAAVLDVDFRVNPLSGHVEVQTNGHVLLATGGPPRHIGLRFTETGGNLVEPVIGDDVVPGGDILNFDPTFRNAFSLMRLDREPQPWDRPGELMGTVMSRGLSVFTHHASQYLSFPRYAPDPGTPGSFMFDPTGMYVRDPGGGFVELNDVEMIRSISQWERRRDFNAHHSTLPRTMRHLDQMFNHTVSMINEFLTNQHASSVDPNQWGTNHSNNSTGLDTVNLWGEAGISIFVKGNPTHIEAARFPTHVWVDGAALTHVPNPPYGPGHMPAVRVGAPIPNEMINPAAGEPGHNPAFAPGDIVPIVEGMYVSDPAHGAALVPPIEVGHVNNNTLNYTLGNTFINPLLLTPEGYNMIGLQQNIADVSDPHILLNLLSTWHAQLISLDGSAAMGIDDFYNQMVLELATSTQRLENMANTSAFAISEIEGERARTFGVSLDEEMTNMIRFQHSFNSSARVVNVLADMIDTLIQRTGRW